MSYPVIISLNSANPREVSLMKDLKIYLDKMNISSFPGDPNIPDYRMKQQLPNAQWLVLFLTPEAIKSPQVQSLVNAAFTYVNQGRMQGILALAFLSNPVDLEDMPSPLWSTIRIYYTGERDEDHQQAFEKLSRTLGYTRVPVRAVSSPANNWATSFSSAASRPQPRMHQPNQIRQPLLIAIVMIVLALFIILSGMALGLISFKKGGSTHSSITTPTHGHTSPTTKSTLTVTTVPTSISESNLYATVTKMNPVLNDPLNQSTEQHNSNQWNIKNPSCAFDPDGMYHVISTPGQYMSCMAKIPKFTTNFAYQVQMTFIDIDGSAGGLIFLSNNTVSKFYRFSLDSTGNYSLRTCQNCSDSKVTNGTLLSQENANIQQSNIPIGNSSYKLTVIVTNKIIYLYIEDTLVDKVTNSIHNQDGEIGVYAASLTQSKSKEVAFSNAKVWEIPADFSIEGQ